MSLIYIDDQIDFIKSEINVVKTSYQELDKSVKDIDGIRLINKFKSVLKSLYKLKKLNK